MTNLPSRVTQAAADLPIMVAGKVGWHAERFWETEYQIYGGISWDTGMTEQVWYPSEGFLSRKGVLTGAYVRGADGEAFNAKPVAQRLDVARETMERLHPGCGGKLEHGVAVAWNRMPHIGFGWANEDAPGFDAAAQVLAAPQGRLHQAGDQLTYWSGWQEGAILSAHAAIRQIDRATRPERTL